MARQILAILLIYLLRTAADNVEYVAPKVELKTRQAQKAPGVCSEACYRVATCNEEVGGRCDCPKHLSGWDCSRNATASRLAAYSQAPVLEARSPMACLNNCTMRGHCVLGACICSRGNFTSDCSMSLGPDGKPQLLAGTGYKPRKKRPRIYVYDIPHKYSSWHNPTRLDRSLHWVFWERLIGSGALVENGDDADWYWLPIKLRSTVDGYRLLEVLRYIRTEWPWYDRLQGHRHFVIHTGDTGRGEVASDVRDISANLTWLHHWGLVDDWDTSGWKAAHRPGKDVVVPIYFGARQGLGVVAMSGLHPRAPRWRRTRTLLFAGRICGDHSKPSPHKPWPHCETNRSSGYSQGVRQMVHFYHHNRTGYRIVTGDARYPVDLLNYNWCLAPSGGGHGHRQVLASLVGCLPLIISDSVMQPFEPEMDWDLFGLRVRHEDIPRLHELLAAFSEEDLERKRAALRCAAQHMVFSTIGGALMQEDGRWDAFEFILEILRMQQTYPGLDPKKYAASDAQFRAFLNCGDDDGMAAYGEKLRKTQETWYSPTELPLPPNAADAVIAAERGWNGITIEQFREMLAKYDVQRDPKREVSPLPLCSNSLFDWRGARCRVSRPTLVNFAPGGAACEG
ncbi:hypothetical protein Vretimale_3596, partial [Volvox reticuliferus]